MTNVRPFYKFVQNYEMQRLILNVLTLIFLFVSCKSTNEKDIIPKKDFVKVLTEIYTTDAYLSTLSQDSAKRVIFSLYDHTFKKYALDSTSFKENLSFYASDAESMNKIYDEVGKNLKKMNEGYMKIEKEKNDAIRRKDSIQNASIQDSLLRVRNWVELYEFQKNMLLNYKPDSVRFDYKKAARVFFEGTGLKGGYNLGTFLMKADSLYASPKLDSTAVVKADSIAVSKIENKSTNRAKEGDKMPLKEAPKPRSNEKEVKKSNNPPILLDRNNGNRLNSLDAKPVK